MALDFEWTGRGWIARKVRRKLAWNEHKGVDYYDRERMRQPLKPIAHPRDFQGWSTPLPSWIDPNWKSTDEPGTPKVGHPIVDDLDAPPIAQTSNYVLERCHVATNCRRHETSHVEGESQRLPVLYRWELTFSDGATFRFVSREIAEAALAELLKIRKAKHPMPRFAKHSPQNESVFFTNRRLHKLPADSIPGEQPIDTATINTAA